MPRPIFPILSKMVGAVSSFVSQGAQTGKKSAGTGTNCGRLAPCRPDFTVTFMMLVEQLMDAARKRLFTLGDEASLIDAATLLSTVDSDIVVICDSATGRLDGVVTKTDVVRQICHCRGAACGTAVSAVMNGTVHCCHVDQPLQEVWKSMKDRHLKNVPIVDDASRPVGILNARDALELLLEEVAQEEAALRDYIVGAGYS